MKKLTRSFVALSVGVLLFVVGTNTLRAQVTLTPVPPATSGLGYGTGGPIGFSWGDFNNDGYLDLLSTTSNGGQNDTLFKNNGNGTFSVVPAVTFNGLNTNYGSFWADFNGDGKLDLLFSNGSGIPAFRIFHGNGDGTFTDATSTYFASGPFPNGGNTMMVSAGDYDRDGYLDLALGGLSR